jgi:tellurite resistance protein TerC
MSSQILLWVSFNLFVFLMLALDLGIFHRKVHEVKIKEALAWCAVWISLALIFNVGVYFWKGEKSALEFLTAYLLEESLSVDNLFVFIQIFAYFRVPAAYQHKVLFWGIIGVLVLRAIFILTGVALISKFHWIVYVFGGFLIYTGMKMATGVEKEIQYEKNFIIRLFRKFMPVITSYEGAHPAGAHPVGAQFFVKKDLRIHATPLFIVLLVIEMTDLVFAVDSIPAVLAISSDPFIVYSSNLFAVLGLRSLYFALAGIMRLFYYLKYGLSLILVLVGIKMLLSDVVHIPVALSLGIIIVVLTLSVIASKVLPHN